MSKQLVTKNKSLQNAKVVIPIDGEVDVVAGTIDISDEAFDVLLSHPDWSDPNAAAESTDAVPDAAALREMFVGLDPDKIKEQDVDSLGQIAEAAGITNWKKFKNNQAALATYVKNQLTKKGVFETAEK